MMRLRTIGLAAALSAGLFQTNSDALVRPRGAEEPVVAPGHAPRTHRSITWSRASQMTALGLSGWTAMWDRDTNVPVRMYGPGDLVPGAMRTPAIAEAAARRFLEQHLRVLAPGAAASDFVVVANQLGGAGDVRSVGFQQYAHGVRVLGGAIGISFKNDRVTSVGSTALPNVPVTAAPGRLDAQRVATAAIAWLADDGYAVLLRAHAAERLIVPLIRPRGAAGLDITYRLAEQVSVESTGEAGRWDVWLDATTAAPIARKTTVYFASGRVLFDVPDRYPGGTRSAKPAPNASHLVNNVATLSTADGTVTWADGTASVSPGLRGPLVAVTNKAGSLATETLSLVDGGSITWSKPTEEFNDSQISAFVFASTAKEYARTHMNAALPWLDDTLSVTVNEPSTCNAYSTGDDIHFYKAAFSNTAVGTNCENTGRIADVVYHEFGHSLHANSIIEGVGAFDGALSEGMSDMLAAFITKDHGMGRGFFFGSEPLRDLDPEGSEKRWPDDTTGEVHDDGEIIGQTMWDLRKALIGKLGEEAGDAQARKIYYGALQRSADIPTTFVESLVSDDDDGDLTNGTPNQCEIYASFGTHGLADPQVTLGLTPPSRDGNVISLKIAPPASTLACNSATLASTKVEWKPRGGQVQTLDLAVEGTTYTGEIPAQATGTVVQYKVTVTMTDGTKLTFPNNVADPFYEFYTGEVEPLWCADFEMGAEGWTHGATPTNRDEWEVGTPMGLGGDPKTAHGGTSVFGIDLTNDGMYRRSVSTWAETPAIDLSAAFADGATPNIRLQYHRWLGVEDGFFDTAFVLANGTKVWSNYASQTEAGGYNHLDKEWQFNDLDVTGQIGDDHQLKLRWELASDAGFNVGGWTLDDVCVVLAKPAPACEDDGTCAPDDGVIDNGCCSVGGSPKGALALSLLTLGALLRRRRRR